MIRQEVGNAIAKVQHNYCILVIPLLAESEAYPNVDRVLVVDVDPETQITRLMVRDNSSRQHAEQALMSQASRQQRLDIADDVLDNSGSPGLTVQAVAQLHRKYMALANRSEHDIHKVEHPRT